MRWLDEDEMLNNFIQDRFGHLTYNINKKHERIYTIDRNLSFDELFLNLNDLFKNRIDTKTFALTKEFNILGELNATLNLEDITDSFISVEKIPWKFKNFVEHHGFRNRDAGNNYSYSPFLGNHKLEYKRGQVIFEIHHFTNLGYIYVSDSFELKKCENTSFIDRILSKSRFCMTLKRIDIYPILNSDIGYNPGNLKIYLESIFQCFDDYKSKKKCDNTADIIYIDKYELDNHGSKYIRPDRLIKKLFNGFYEMYE